MTAGCYEPLSLSQKWQTPRADGFDAGRHRGKADSLHSQIKQWPTSNGPTKKLNPLFVEWLMGLPEGWTSLEPLDCGRSAMASCQRKPPTHCAN